MSNRVFAFALVASLAVLSARADTILVRGKEPVKGVTVVKESIAEVEYTKGAAKRHETIPTSEVLGIVFDQEPRDYRKGTEYFNLGDFVNAVARLRAAIQSADGKTPWLKEYASVYIGRASLAAGQFDDGVQAFEQALATKPDTRWLGEASIGLARCHAALGRFDRAKAALQNLKAKASAVKGGEALAFRADIVLGEVLFDEKKYDEAVRTLKDVAQALDLKNDLPQSAALYSQARRLQGEVHLAAGEGPNAKLAFDELARRAASGDAFAKAAAGTGRAQLAMSEANGDLEKLASVKYALSQVVVENFQAASEQARACYLLGLVNARLADLAQVSGAKALATGYFEETLHRFPESRDARLAREELKKR